MILKTNNNTNFNLSMKLDINYELKYIDILIIFSNIINNKKQMFVYHGNEFKEALKKYSELEQLIF